MEVLYELLNITFSFEMAGTELCVYVKTLDVFSLLQIETLLLISQMLKNGQVCPYSLAATNISPSPNKLTNICR
jgi:hypothetical protein